MKILIWLLLILLTSSAAWSAEKSGDGTARKNAEEDICYAYFEYREAENIFRIETNGSYRPGTNGAQLARQAEMKQDRLNSLLKRYHRNYGKWFNPQRNPQACSSYEQ